MKLTFFANACCIYESEGKRLLTDPWLIDGAFDGSWYHYPPLKTRPEDLKNVDYLYISHLHPDHFCIRSLAAFRKTIPIIVLDHGANFLTRLLEREGFINIRPQAPGEEKDYRPFKIKLFPPFTGNPFFTTELGNLIDSAMVIQDKQHIILNTNDNTPNEESAEALKKVYDFDLVQLNYNAAGPYPSCFMNLTPYAKKKKHREILLRNLEHMNKLTKIFKAKYVQPFAGAYIIGGSKSYKNEYLGTTIQDNAARYLTGNGSPSISILLNEGQTFDLGSGVSDGKYKRINRKEQRKYIKQISSKKYPYEEMGGLSWVEKEMMVSDFLPKARMNLYKYQERLNLFFDLQMTIQVGTKHFSFNFDKDLTKTESKNTIHCRLAPELLKMILERKAHWNNAEIGCHIDFFREPDVYNFDMHTLMSFFHLPS